MSWSEAYERCCRTSGHGARRNIESWTARLIMLGVVLMWLGVAKAVLRGAKLYSQDVSGTISSVLIPLAGGVVALGLVLGIGLIMSGAMAKPGPR